MSTLKNNKQGVALILALLFIVLLTALVVEFAYDTQVEASFAMNQGSDFHAYLAAKSAVAQGLALLAEDELALDDPLNPNLDLIALSDGQFDGAIDNWAVGVPFQPLNEATMRTTISDEYGKINLNALLFAVEGQEPQVNETLAMALHNFFMDRMADASGYDGDEDQVNMIIDGILDWLDYNDTDDPREDGAENDYYLSLENPYPCKNGPMDTIEELLLIRGMTPELYFGVSTEEVEQRPLSEYLTVHGDWLGRMNVNTMAYETIIPVADAWNFDATALLEERFNDPNGTGGTIVSQQQLSQLVQITTNNAQPNGQANDNDDDEDEDGGGGGGVANQQIENPLIIHSNVFRIHGDGRHDNILVRIEAYVMRIPVEDNAAPPLPPIAQDLNLENELQVEEQFRILDWKVIR